MEINDNVKKFKWNFNWNLKKKKKFVSLVYLQHDILVHIVYLHIFSVGVISICKFSLWMVKVNHWLFSRSSPLPSCPEKEFFLERDLRSSIQFQKIHISMPALPLRKHSLNELYDVDLRRKSGGGFPHRYNFLEQ